MKGHVQQHTTLSATAKAWSSLLLADVLILIEDVCRCSISSIFLLVLQSNVNEKSTTSYSPETKKQSPNKKPNQPTKPTKQNPPNKKNTEGKSETFHKSFSVFLPRNRTRSLGFGL